jgi:putative sterol carrier protein
MAFTGKKPIKGTAIIKNKELIVEQGHMNKANISITADSQTWVGFLTKEKNMLAAIATRKIRIKGSP